VLASCDFELVVMVSPPKLRPAPRRGLLPLLLLLLLPLLTIPLEFTITPGRTTAIPCEDEDFLSEGFDPPNR
jgi:hypothetical protein